MEEARFVLHYSSDTIYSTQHIPYHYVLGAPRIDLARSQQPYQAYLFLRVNAAQPGHTPKNVQNKKLEILAAMLQIFYQHKNIDYKLNYFLTE